MSEKSNSEQAAGTVRRQAGLVALLVASDLASVAFSFIIAFFARRVIPGLPPLAHGFEVYLAAAPALVLWTLMFWQHGLYPGFWLTGQDEVRRIAIATSVAGLLATALTFVTQTGLVFSRPIVVGGWLISLVLVPGARALARGLASRLGLAGPAAVVLGGGEAAQVVLDRIRRRQPPPLVPMAAFDDDPARLGERVGGVEVVGALEAALDWARRHKVEAAIVALPGVRGSELLGLLGRLSQVTPRILIVSELAGVSGADLVAHDLQGMLALELRNNLLSKGARRAKRLIDLALLAATSIVTLPLALAVGLAILVESGRPVIFGHRRIGRDGRPFRAWKFRSMAAGSGQRLPHAVDTHPGLRQEWDSRHKLRDDPRLTRVGRVLRRTSLDELPQLWNVLRGEMSLVGPRPIVAEEVPRYGDSLELYTRVLPGLTGLWQISGRSNTTYDERVRLDVYYVRSWSLWMDLVILLRTLGVVLSGTGAY